jgi:hypothetical protein
VRRLFLAALLLTTALAAHAQNLSKALVVPSCNGSTRELAESSLGQLMMNPQGQLCAGSGNAGTANMTTPILSYGNAGPPVGGTFHLPITGSNAWNGNVQLRQSVIPIDGVISNFVILLPVAPITTNYFTLSLNVNGVSTALQCSIGQGGVNLGTPQQCSDAVDQIAVHPGDLLSLQSSVPGGAPAPAPSFITTAMTLTSTNGQESFIGSSPNPFMSTTAIQYFAPGTAALPQATDALASAIMPTAGKLDYLYAVSNPAQLVGNSVRFTVVKNGVPTSIAATCTNAASLCTDLVNAITVVAGDTISIQMCPGGVAGCQAGAASASRAGGFGLRFTPATPDQAMVFGVPVPAGMPAPAVALRLGALSNAVNFVGTFDQNYQNIAPVQMTLGNLTIAQCPGPDTTGAGGVTRTQTLRANGVNQSPTVALVGNSTAACPTLAIGQDTADTYQTNANDLVGLGMTMNTITNASTLEELKYSMTATAP